MKKNQLKQAALLGLSTAALIVSGTAEGSVLETPGVVLAGACGGSGCASHGTQPTKTGRSQVAMEDVKPANGHSCSGASGATGVTGADQKASGSCNGKSGGSCNAKSSCNGARR